MTGKELMYIEDALGHEQYFKTQFGDTAGKLQDAELQNFAREMSTRHGEIFSVLYDLL